MSVSIHAKVVTAETMHRICNGGIFQPAVVIISLAVETMWNVASYMHRIVTHVDGHVSGVLFTCVLVVLVCLWTRLWSDSNK